MARVARSCPGAIAFCAALAAAFSASGQSTPPVGSIAKAGDFDASVQFHVVWARDIALEKLGSPDCRRLFAEFHDLAGRPLEEVLEARDESAQQHLRRMEFLDGSRAPECGQPGVLAFTHPGSLAVFVCSAFRHMTRRKPAAAANILIHEELHSLGAGEAPAPGLLSATEITSRVEKRCGR